MVKQGDDSVYDFQEVPITGDPGQDPHQRGHSNHQTQYQSGSSQGGGGGQGGSNTKKEKGQRTKYPGTMQVGANGEKRKVYQCSECAFYSHRSVIHTV